MNFPSLHGNWVDFGLVLFLLFYIWEGWGKEFIGLFLDLLVFILAFLLALKFYPLMGNLLVENFSFPQGLARAVGFFILGVVIEQMLSYFADILEGKIPAQILKHKLNKFFSIVPLIGNAVVLVTFILTLALSLPLQGFVKKGISESKLASPMIGRTQVLESQLASVFGEALSDTLNFITITSLPNARDSVRLNFRQQNLVVDIESEIEMLSRVNKERRDQGIRELKMNESLRDLSRTYARDMFERGYFSHYNPEGASPFDRMKAAGITYRAAGENLALAPNVTIAHQGLMDSDGHRKNILSPDYGQVGIGVVDGGIYGKMFVQEFTD